MRFAACRKFPPNHPSWNQIWREEKMPSSTSRKKANNHSLCSVTCSYRLSNLFLLRFSSGLKTGAHSSLPFLPNSFWVCDVQVAGAGLFLVGEEGRRERIHTWLQAVCRESWMFADLEDVRTSQPSPPSPFLWIRK